MSDQTARLAVTPAPAGKPGGPGLWRVKGMALPPYFEQVRNALIRSGKTPAEAYAITWGAIRRWARGGGKAHPEVVAAAQAALADLAAKSARAHAHSNEGDAVTSVDLASAWNEALHPRISKGNSGGGEFGSASKGAAPVKAAPLFKAGAKGAAPTDKNPVGFGASGPQVAGLQARLNALGLKPPLAVDGKFGPKVLAAVKAFQKAHGLKVDGLVGPKTTAALRGTAKTKTARSVSRAAAETAGKRKVAKSAAAAGAAAAASSLKLSGDARALELAATMSVPRIRGAVDVACKSTGGMIAVTHKTSGMKIGTVAKTPGGWQGTHATGRKTPVAAKAAGAVSGLIRLHNKVAAAMPAPAFSQRLPAVELATSAVTSGDGPRMTMMAGGKTAAVPAPAVKLYRKLRGQGMSHPQALALSKRAKRMKAKGMAKAA